MVNISRTIILQRNVMATVYFTAKIVSCKVAFIEPGVRLHVTLWERRVNDDTGLSHSSVQSLPTIFLVNVVHPMHSRRVRDV